MMDLKIKRNSNFTIHTQLKEQLKNLILNNILKNGEQLPTVRQLGESLRVNKNTVSKVYIELEEENYIESIQGRGSFVKYDGDLQKIKDFYPELDKFLKKAFEIKINPDEILGMIYSRMQDLKYISAKGEKKAIFIECNENSIKEFKKMIKKEMPKVEIMGILIENLKNHFDKIKESVKDFNIIILPYIHYEEIKSELKKLKKEIITIGTRQSIKILVNSNKLKNKKVGIISYSEEDEQAILKQFKTIKYKENYFYGGIEKRGLDDLENFISKVDILVICSSIYNKINFEIKKTYFIFEGKYDIEDLKIIKEIFI